jgi:malonyl CoA-acyl carrier protein transacylase
MRLPFSGRNEKLETMNRILTEAAQKRTERIEELERRVAQLERELETARRELETARESIERAKLLEVVAAERAQLINEKDKQLADVREVATKYYFRIQELERALADLGVSDPNEHPA